MKARVIGVLSRSATMRRQVMDSTCRMKSAFARVYAARSPQNRAPSGYPGMDLPSSVAPFILRGVCLLGIDSVMCPLPQRKLAWNRLASDLDKGKLAEITQEINLDQVIGTGAQILAGQVRGRIVVKIL